MFTSIQVLLDSEVRMQRIIESASDAFLEMDRDGRIVSANKSACKLFGLSVDVLVGKTVRF